MGAKSLPEDHPVAQPATSAIRFSDQSIHFLVREDGPDDWDLIAEFPRNDLPGAPAMLCGRSITIGFSWLTREPALRDCLTASLMQAWLGEPFQYHFRKRTSLPGSAVTCCLKLFKSVNEPSELR
jgi:hypothetical protein